MAREGKCVVIVLHDIIQALSTADKIVVLKEGRVMGEDTPENIYDSSILDEIFSVSIKRENGHYYYTEKDDEGI